MSAKAIVCAQCGSNDVLMVTQYSGVCNCCNTKLIIEKEQSSDEPRVVIVHPVGEKQEDMRFCSLKSVWEPEQFAREAYIRLFSTPQTPRDIHKADFLPVVTEYPQFARFLGDYTLNYSVDLGYHRSEQYTVYETKESGGTKPVTETRIVTDWKPFFGAWRCENVETFCAVPLPEKSNINKNFEKDEVLALEHYFAKQGLKGVESYEESNLAVQIVPPSSEDTQRAMKRKADELAPTCKKTLPGDERRNFSYTFSATAKNVDWLVAPEYALGFSYEGENYEIRSFAAENGLRHAGLPKKDVRKEIVGEVRSQRRKTLWFPLLGMLILGFLLYFSGIKEAVGYAILIMIPYIIGHSVCWYRIVSQGTTERIKKYQEEKFQHLQRRMRCMGMSPLSEEESARFFQEK